MLQTYLLVAVLLFCQVIPAPNKWSVPPDEGIRYWRGTLAPMLGKYQADSQELASVRNRLDQFALDVTNGNITFLMIGSPVGELIGKVDYDSTALKPVIYFFVPTIQALQKSLTKAEFEHLIVITVVHEMIHLEQSRNGEFPTIESRVKLRDNAAIVIAAKDEAAAWGKTILEVIRPWHNQGKPLPANLLENSKQLKLVNDDYTHPAWVLAIGRASKVPKAKVP